MISPPCKMKPKEAKLVKLKLKGTITHHAPAALLQSLHLHPGTSKALTCAITGKPIPLREPYLQLQPSNEQPAAQSALAQRTRRSPSTKAAEMVLSLTSCKHVLAEAMRAEGIQVSGLAGWERLSKKQKEHVQGVLEQQDDTQRQSEAGVSCDAEMGNGAVQGETQGVIQRDTNMEEVAADIQLASGKDGGRAKVGSKGKADKSKVGEGNGQSQIVADGSNVGDAPALSEYERQRAEQIERNRQFMASLALPEAGEAVASVTAATRAARTAEKGLSGHKRSAPAPYPSERRVSLRVRGMQADPTMSAGVESELSRGKVLLAANAGTNSIWNSGAGLAHRPVAGGEEQPREPKERHPTGPLPFKSENGTEDSDSAFLQYLRTRLQGEGGDEPHLGAAGVASDAGAGTGGAATAATVRQLRLREGDVAKMTTRGTAHLAWHPSPGPLLLAAGDKEGRLALWQVDYQRPEAEGQAQGESPSEFDGVAVFDHVHRQYVSALAWVAPPGSSGAPVTQLLSAAYDGSIRMLDVQQGLFQDYSKGLPPDMEISAMDLDAVSGIAYVGDNEGNFDVLDLRTGKAVRSGLVLHTKRINSLHLEPLSRRFLLSSGSDACVRVWDVRMLGASGTGDAVPVCELGHRKSCHSAYWAPDGSQRVLSTCYDDTLRIWKPTSEPLSDVGEEENLPQGAGQLQAGVVVKHDNQTGRWVTPFRAIWSAESDYVAVGSMKRGVDVFNSNTGGQIDVCMTSELMTAIPSRLAAHPCCPVLAAATSSGRVHVWR